MATSAPLLECRGVSKALRRCPGPLPASTSRCARGEVMALVGDNGAGKSTLIKCIAGIYPLDEGEVFFEGEHVHDPRAQATRPGSASRSSTRTSRSRDNLDVVAEHVPRPRAGPHGSVVLDELEHGARSAPRRSTASPSRRIRSVRQTVAGLSGGQRQSVAVAKAVMWNSKLVILDEPTAALGVAQTRQVLDLVQAPRRAAVSACVIVSHNLHDVFEVRRPDHGPAPRPERGRSSSGRRRRQQEVVARDHRRRRSTKVPGMSEDGRVAVEPRLDPTPTPTAAVVPEPTPEQTQSRRGYIARLVAGRARPASSARCRSSSAWSPSSIVFQIARTTNFLTERNFANLHRADGGRTRRSRMGVVFVLLLGEIDLSVGVRERVSARSS